MAAGALYSPYGNYELKSRYQRNFLFGTGITAGFVMAIILTGWLISLIPEEEVVGGIMVRTITTVADLGPPPSIARKPPQVSVAAPQTAAPKVGIPKPVADEEVIDDDVVLATRDELAEIVIDVATISDGDDIVVDIEDDDYLPAIGEFVSVEVEPAMVLQHAPEYPRFAKTAGIEGTVWVHALVGKNGKVRDAKVAKSSGTAALDEAAVEAAYKNTFSPGIQNGRPVNCWVSYKVDFSLDDN